MAPHTSEPKRLREVRRYYRRSSSAGIKDNLGIAVSGVSADRVSSPNNLLTALMQLLACRLNMQRAMVSVVDENNQYFLAESTRTLDLSDSSRHEEDLWLGCGGTTRGEALCANTIEVEQPREPDRFACFSVTDLAKDPRFCNLPYVAAKPNFRFYAGTPLVTRDNIPIGSVFVIDDRVRGPPTKFEIDYLGVIAQDVMEYLEMRRESEMRMRTEVMTQGMAAFLEGKSSMLQFSEANSSDGKENKRSEDDEASLLKAPTTDSLLPARDTEPGSPPSTIRKDTLNLTNAHVNFDESSGSDVASSPTRKSSTRPEKIPTQDQILLQAANLLKESLDVNYTVFFDVSVKPPVITEGPEHDGDEKGGSVNDMRQSYFTRSSFETVDEISETNGLLREEQQTTNHQRQPRTRAPAKVLSVSTNSSPDLNGNLEYEDDLFRSPDYKCLRRLIKKYPDGKLWLFNDDGVEISEEDQSISDERSISPKAEKHSTAPREAKFILDCFPGVKQILFAPLLDVETAAHVAVCFAISFEPIPAFSTEVEIAFLRGFLNSVSMACSRASMATANRQKGDFISSISHELRSPLHGIIASAELLTGSSLNARQKEFCHTISTCGQTLLETITGILEYTKINTLRSEARGLAADKSRVVPAASLTRQNSQLQNMTVEPLAISSTDLKTVCEDAVTIVTAAHRLTASTASQTFDHVFTQTSKDKIHGEKPLPVTIILDIKPGDWNFATTLGSFQRTVMNLVTNSLKYTRVGWIIVTLSIHNGSQGKGVYDSIVKLHVSDSGQGISREFMPKLFLAFTQESKLAQGIGLGLNIVKGLIEDQNGSIKVESEGVGRGTQVTVELPLKKPAVKTSENPQQAFSSAADELISALSKSQNPKHFTIHGFQSAMADLIPKSIRQYLLEWFDMHSTPDDQEADIVFVDEEGLPACLGTVSNYRQKPRVIVVCDQLRQQPASYTQSNIQIEILTLPFGPNKLSKTVLACLEPTKPINSISIPISNGEPPAMQELASPPILELPLSGSDVSFLSIAAIDSAVGKIQLNALPEVPAQHIQQARVLCVDDNSTNLRVLMAFMEKLNFRDVAFAVNGSAAFEAVRYDRKGFDLIFMDLSMPICDGFQAISLIRSLEKMQIRATPPDIPLPKPAVIAALTGLASQRDQEAARAAGADHYLTKPLKFSRLKELLVEWGISVK